jgi:hypothetical protein
MTEKARRILGRPYTHHARTAVLVVVDIVTPALRSGSIGVASGAGACTRARTLCGVVVTGGTTASPLPSSRCRAAVRSLDPTLPGRAMNFLLPSRSQEVAHPWPPMPARHARTAVPVVIDIATTALRSQALRLGGGVLLLARGEAARELVSRTRCCPSAAPQPMRDRGGFRAGLPQHGRMRFSSGGWGGPRTPLPLPNVRARNTIAA